MTADNLDGAVSPAVIDRRYSKIFPVAETISGIVALSLPEKEVFI